MTATTPPRSYEERHRAGTEVFDTMQAGTVDVARAATAMVRRNGPLGSFAVDYVMGDLWSRPQLSRRDRSLIVIAVLAAQGSTDELGAHVGIGLNHGLTRDEVDEIVVQVAAYGGYPMAMAASRVVEQTFCRIDGVDRQPPRSPAPSKDDEQRWADAADVLGTLTGGRTSDVAPEQLRANLVEQMGGIGELVFDWAFGEVWAGERLSRRDRSLVVLAILTLLSKPEELAFHVPAALHHGVTRTEVEEVMVQLCVYGGFPRAIEGMRAVREAWSSLDAVLEPPTS